MIYGGWHPFLFSEDATVPASSLRPHSDASANRKWVERLERFAASNQTVAAFCTAEGVSLSNFYLWRRRLAKPTPPAVVPIRVAPPPTPATPIEVALPSGTVVRFPADARPELLIAVLRGLEERPC
jgi:transposase